jgi:peptidoglycan/LPS O-acetylase OafA/YrhL
MTRPAGTQRLECLDGLRGALAFYVLLWHLVPFTTLPAWIVWPLLHGQAGVDMFFVLSGMVIVRSLEHYDYHARPFLIARAARIFPVFLPVFALAVAVQPVSIDFAGMPWIAPDSPARMIWSDGWPHSWAADLLAHLTMLHGIFPNAVLPHVWVSFLGAAWSLSSEWQFYALVALIGARFGRGEDGRRRLVLLLLGLALAAAAWHQMVPPDWRFSRAFLPNKAAYFALGVASAGLVEDLRRWPRFVAVLGAVLVLVLCLRDDNALTVLGPFAWVVCLAAQSAQGRSAGSLGGGARSRGAWSRGAWGSLRALGALLRSASLRRLGAVSYCLYLVTEPLQKLLGVMLAQVAGGRATIFTLLWVPTAVLIPLLAAWWLHRCIEVPMLRRGRVLAASVLARIQRPPQQPVAAELAAIMPPVLQPPSVLP